MADKGTELAVAYVTILPSTKGLGASLATQLAPATGAAGKAAGESVSKGMLSSVKGLAAGLAAAGIVTYAKQAIGLAEESVKSTTRLQNAVKNAGGEWSKYGDIIGGKVSGLMQKAAFDDEMLNDALSTLIQTTGSVTKGTDLLALSTDVARGRNMDLAASSLLVAKVSQGVLTPLTRMGIKLKEGATVTEALAALQKKYGGAAEAFGNSQAGAAEKARIAWTELQESVGLVLLPQMNELNKAGAEFAFAFSENKGLAKASVYMVEFGAAATAILMVGPKIAAAWAPVPAILTKAAVGVGTAGKGLLALAAGPVGVSVAALAGLFGTAALGVKGIQELEDHFGYAGLAAQNFAGGVQTSGAAVNLHYPVMISAHNGMTAAVTREGLARQSATQWVNRHTAAYKGLDPILGQLGRTTQMVMADTNAAAAAFDDGTAALDAHVAAVRGLTHALDATQSAEEMQLEKHLAVKAATEDLTEARKHYKAGSDEVRLAELKLVDAKGQAAAADKLMQDRVAANEAALLRERRAAYLAEGAYAALARAKKQAAGYKLTAIDVGNRYSDHATGTITSGPEVALIGEGGYPETVASWDPRHRQRTIGLLNDTIAGLGLAVQGGGGGNTYNTTNVNNFNRPVRTHSEVIQAMREIEMGLVFA